METAFEEWVFGVEDKGNKDLQSVEKTIQLNDKQMYSNSKVFYVKDLSLSETKTEPKTELSFASHSEIGCFRIDGNQSYRDSNVKPNLLQYSDSICKQRINLLDGFEDSKIIQDYKSYKVLKWQCFLTWINKSQLLVNRSDEVRPHFVSFGGLFTSLLMTPFRMESWSLLVCKHRDCIFMNKIRLNQRNEFNSTNRPNKGFIDRGPYYASKFTSIITKSDPSLETNSVLNEFDKYFAVYETQFGSHRLLLMNEFDAVDEEGNRYEIKCAKNVNYRQKLLNWWSHCVVADIDYILIGLRDSNDILNQIEKLKTEELPEHESFRWDTNEAFIFVDRILNHIKELLSDSNDGDIYKVWYQKGSKCIRNSKLSDNKLLPQWFLDGKCHENVPQFVD